MLKVTGVTHANLGASYANGTTFAVEWVTIATPDNALPTIARQLRVVAGPRPRRRDLRASRGLLVRQRRARSTSSRPAAASARARSGNTIPQTRTIRLLFQSPGAAMLNAPDNITVSPRGGLVLCEDGGGEEFMHGLTVDGEIFQFAKNNVVLNGERNGIVGELHADLSGPAPATARTASGCSRTFRVPESRSRSPGPGSPARCNSH